MTASTAPEVVASLQGGGAPIISYADIARFLKYVEFAPRVGDCAIWRGGRNPDGYGCFRLGSRKDGTRRSIGAHRFAWIALHGPIAPGLSVCHKCDNPACVEPSHLWLGTQGQNWEDMRVKGRHSAPRGSTHPRWNGGPEAKKKRDRDKKRWRYNNDSEYRRAKQESNRARRAL